MSPVNISLAYRKMRWPDVNDSAFERVALNATIAYVRARVRALFEKNERENKCAQARAHIDARAETTKWSTVRLLLFERQANTWLRARRPSRQCARIYACAGTVRWRRNFWLCPPFKLYSKSPIGKKTMHYLVKFYESLKLENCHRS